MTSEYTQRYVDDLWAYHIEGDGQRIGGVHSEIDRYMVLADLRDRNLLNEEQLVLFARRINPRHPYCRKWNCKRTAAHPGDHEEE